MSLQAGTGVVDITPRRSMFLVGYPHVPRMSQGVHDPLLATALCLKTPQASLIIVALDVLLIEKVTTARCRKAIHKATGVPPEHILMSATHTHSGPVTFEYLSMSGDPVVQPPDPEYMKQFEAGIVAAAVEAWQNTVPARVASTTAKVDGVGGNRLSPDGIRDPEAGLLYVVQRETRHPLAVLLAYAMHPTVLHEDSLLFSADFPGATRACIQRCFPDVAVLYHTGPSGNQSPRYHVQGQTFAEAERLGERLGEAVCAALTTLPVGAFDDAPALAAVQRRVDDLPPRRFPAVTESVALLTEAQKRYQQLKHDKAGHGPVRTAECVIFGAEERLVLSRTQEEAGLAPWLARALPAEVQVLRVGETQLVGLPGELFVEYALEIKRRGTGKTIVISMANGELQGYIVTPEAEQQGGYEAGCSMFTAAAGAKLVAAAIEGMQATA